VKVTIIASGSKGNSLVIDFGSTRIAVDAGFGSRRLAQRYRAAGIAPESVSACVITHEHLDHAKGALVARRKWHWTLAATPQTLAALGANEARGYLEPANYGETLSFGDARVTLHKVTHDAIAPAAVLVEDCLSGVRIGIAYDLGIIPATLATAFERLDMLIVEANHDPGMLRAGPYPPVLQARISSPRGHLSNHQSANFAREMVHPGLRTVVLAHLSEHNNTPRIAHETVARQLRRTRFRGKLGAASQNSSCTIGDVAQTQLELRL
jgi:phosphoribosyl 1,2-cyclic phosphodiesterase